MLLYNSETLRNTGCGAPEEHKEKKMKKFKRSLALILVLVMTFCLLAGTLVSCKDNTENPKENDEKAILHFLTPELAKSRF